MALTVDFEEQGAAVTVTFSRKGETSKAGVVLPDHGIGSFVAPRRAAERLLSELLALGVDVYRQGEDVPQPPVLSGEARVKRRPPRPAK